MSNQQIQPGAPTGPSATGTNIAPILFKKFVSSKKAQSISGLWMLGIFLCCFVNPPDLPPETTKAYMEKMNESQRIPGLHEAQMEVQEAMFAVEAAQTWFWRFREPDRTNVLALQKDLEHAKKRSAALLKERDALEKEAKSIVGLWSVYAIEDCRTLFWSTVEKGKVFAKRQTFWNGLQIVLNSRDGNVFSFILDWVFAMVTNFTLGLLGALVAFIWYLGDIVSAYSTNVFTGAFFYSCAVLAAVSMTATYLVGLYGAAGTGVYFMAKSAQTAARLEGQRRQDPRYIRNQAAQRQYRQQFGRRHYE
ncbi:hypothetical protein CYMTET_24953 [Cymbomonas tetramitiformis]|uniref:Uncharacterized protein n=1 Tax=Cymbomonas tetramitiformis TaxID=36881 RepID=A0AAE0KZQ2_9CHLO|nr:hypothetical protein CYMTET_24953 [Cymbomonas tetramitiformis]